jgi:hypothetical protein
MFSLPEINSMQRVLAAIETYCYQVGDYGGDDLLNAWLKQHLSIQDWIMWQRLRVGQMALRQVMSAEARLPSSLPKRSLRARRA